MFITFKFQSFIESIVKRQDESTDRTIKVVQEYLNKTLEAKERECQFYIDQVKILREQVERERHRADEAIDRLLVRDAHVAPVKVALAGKKGAEEDPITKQLKQVFDQVAGVGEDEGVEPNDEKIVVAGVPLQ